jgi:hypothetical protein
MPARQAPGGRPGRPPGPRLRPPSRLDLRGGLRRRGLRWRPLGAAPDAPETRQRRLGSRRGRRSGAVVRPGGARARPVPAARCAGSCAPDAARRGVSPAHCVSPAAVKSAGIPLDRRRRLPLRLPLLCPLRRRWLPLHLLPPLPLPQPPLPLLSDPQALLYRPRQLVILPLQQPLLLQLPALVALAPVAGTGAAAGRRGRGPPHRAPGGAAAAAAWAAACFASANRPPQPYARQAAAAGCRPGLASPPRRAPADDAGEVRAPAAAAARAPGAWRCCCRCRGGGHLKGGSKGCAGGTAPEQLPWVAQQLAPHRPAAATAG